MPCLIALVTNALKLHTVLEPCQPGYCFAPEIYQRIAVTLIGLVPFAYMCLTRCMGGLSPLSPVGGIAFSSLNNSMFFPKNSLLTSNPSTVVCHSDSASSSWSDSGGMMVTTIDTFPVHQEFVGNNSRLVVNDIDQFTNGVYQCMSNAGSASLGLFIRPPGK